MGVDTYYRLGHIEAEGVYRYTINEALQEMHDLGHYGPWVEGWEDAGHDAEETSAPRQP